MNDVESIAAPRRAAILLAHPIRTRILAAARAAISASDLARALGQPRQRLNYHVRQLAKAGFLLPLTRQKKRNMLEQQYLASARAYVLAPEVLGDVAPATEAAAPDTASAAHLVALCARVQAEVAQVMAAAGAAGVRVRTVSLETEPRFESVAQRTEFTRALVAAVHDVVATHSSSSIGAAPGPGAGRPFKLFLGCYPAAPPGNPG